MNLKEAGAIAKQHVAERFAGEAPHRVRLEHFLYDDHLAVWSLTIGFALPDRPEERGFKVVRVSQVDKSILSVGDR